MSTRLVWVVGLMACCAGVGLVDGDLVRFVNGYEVLSHKEASQITAGDFENKACGLATGTCPSGTPAAPNSCTMSTIAGCVVSSCYSCTAGAGAKYKQCISFPATNCLRNYQGTPCGNKSKDGCDLQTWPVTTCVCNGPMGPLSAYCDSKDCATDFDGDGNPG